MNRHTTTTTATFLLLALLLAPAHAATVDVHVTNVAAGKGKINVAVCDREHFLKDCVYHGSAPAQLNAAGETVVTVQGVPAGTWAVLAYQDENSNDDLDRLLGIPRENYGFSRDARGHFGPPGFDDTAVPVKEPANAVVVRLH
jgi:uncharacterized protein (DUF2141 family)